MTFYKAFFQSNLGRLTLLSDDNNLLGLWFKGQKYYGADYDLNSAVNAINQPPELALKWLTAYFSGQKPSTISLAIKPLVSPFRQQVFQELQKVPYGEVITYKELSDRLQGDNNIKANKAQAIGNALGHNPISLIIPCHRVIASNGSLMGYAGGIKRKRALLKMENPNIKFNKQLTLL